MVHGRLKPAERDAEMTRFRDGELDVLVGTTVVEVGVDVPGGDDDGHRGRRPVRARPAPPAARPGRPRQRRVVLRARLRLDRRDGAGPARGGRRAHDGFELAEKDFELRQEGDVLGLAQSGLPRLRVASLQVAEHRELAVRARAHAEALLDDDGRAGARAARPSPRELDERLARGGSPPASRRAGA